MKQQILLFLCCSLLNSISFATPKTVMMIRHGEKDEPGINVNWTDPFSGRAYHAHGLNRFGWQRAHGLAALFTMDSRIKEFGEIVALFAPNPDTSYNSARPIQTIAPLSEQLRLPIQAVYSVNQAAELINDIMTNPVYDGQTVLIAYEHTRIPGLAKLFKAHQAPKVWPDKAFDRVWVLEFDLESGKVIKFTNMPQRLMFNDSQK